MCSKNTTESVMLDSRLSVECSMCHVRYILNVRASDVERWQSGGYIQDCMPYLTAEWRELLISRTCPKCWDVLFSVDGIEDDDDPYFPNIE